MYSQCPACLAIYRLEAHQLKAHGIVRCGVCGHFFRATACLRDRVSELDTEPPAETETQAEDDPQRPTLPLETPAEPLEQPEPVETDPGMTSTEPLDHHTDADLPLPGTRAIPSPRRWPWLLAIVLLSLSALLQAAWLGRTQLATLPATAQLVQPLCQHLPCGLQPERNPDAIQAVDRSVQNHPSIRGAMLISVTMVNRAGKPQPWPVIELKLADLNGQIMAMRRFKPAEYLQDPQHLTGMMPPDVLVPVVLETLDPGRDVVAYEFDFL